MTNHGMRYIKLTNNPITKTINYKETINIDIDANKEIVGIELLTPDTKFSLTTLQDHINKNVK